MPRARIILILVLITAHPFGPIVVILLLLLILVPDELILHGWANGLIVVIEGVLVGHGALAPGRAFAGDRLHQILLDHRSLGKVGHRRPLLHLVGHAAAGLGVGPVVARLLQLSNPLFQSLLLADQVLHLIKRVFAGEVFEDHEPLSQVLVLVLQLKDFRVLVVDQL